MDFTKSEITITTQAEMDAVPVDYHGRIYIRAKSRISVSKRYPISVVAWENSSVVARGNSSVEAWGNSSVVARDNSSVEARENISVVAWENSSVVARDNSSVVAWENSSVVAWENSSVVAWGNSSVVAWGNSSVVARDNSSVEARGFSHAAMFGDAEGKAHDKAAIIYPNKCIEDFMVYHSIKHTKTKSTWYKAVHKEDGRYYAGAHRYGKPRFEYIVGKTAVQADVDTDVNEDCGVGLHIANLRWALDYGRNWDDLAILEVEVKTADIVLPINSDGKVRVGKLKVLREVPLEECGLYGKILARQRKEGL